jgi:hypothetical protein
MIGMVVSLCRADICFSSGGIWHRCQNRVFYGHAPGPCSRHSHASQPAGGRSRGAQPARHKAAIGHTHAPSAGDWSSPADDTRRPPFRVRLVRAHALVLAQLSMLRRRHAAHGRLLPGRHHLDVHDCASRRRRVRAVEMPGTTPPMSCRLKPKQTPATLSFVAGAGRDRVGRAWCLPAGQSQAQSGSVNCQEGGPHRAC